MLANWIGAPMASPTPAVNTAWYVKYEWNGKDAYRAQKGKDTPTIRYYNEERCAMRCTYWLLRHKSSGHNSEYNWWFRKRPDLIEKYCTHGTGWNPGHYAYILDEYRKRESDWKDGIRAWLAQDQISLDRGHEYASYIINALQGGEIFQFNGNVPNTGLITNLPPDVCVEVPVYVDKGGLHPVHVGALPRRLLNSTRSLRHRGDGGEAVTGDRASSSALPAIR